MDETNVSVEQAGKENDTLKTETAVRDDDVQDVIDVIDEEDLNCDARCHFCRKK